MWKNDGRNNQTHINVDVLLFISHKLYIQADIGTVDPYQIFPEKYMGI